MALSTGTADALVREATESNPYPLGASGRWARLMADPGLTATQSGALFRRRGEAGAAALEAACQAAELPGQEAQGPGLGPDGWGNVGSGGERGEWWRDFFAARELWDAIDYDTWNGTYPCLFFLAADECPGDPDRLEALQRKEEDGTLTRREAEELWLRQELHYDTMYGLFPATLLPDELKYMVTRIIFLYKRLAPPVVDYTPDMHRVLAPLLYVAMRDPAHGLRDRLADRELHISATGHDSVEAQVCVFVCETSGRHLAGLG